MTDRRPSLLTRDDTFLGVCEGLGQDLGVNSLWFRAAFALALFFQPALVIGTYLALGLVVAAARRLYPNPAPAAPAGRAVAPRPDNDGDAPEMAEAA